MTTPVLCVVGPSGSGKTLVVEALLRFLSAQGYRVAAAKHCPHGYRLDQTGTDSDRLRAAGALRVALVSPTEWAVLGRADADTSLETVVERMGEGCDLVVAEGFRDSPAPKVLVLPNDPDPTWQLPQGVIAVVSDRPARSAPWQCGFQELERLAELVRAQFLASPSNGMRVSLSVDGQEIPLAPFAASIIANALWGMVQSLKGVPPEVSVLRIEVRRSPAARDVR